MKRNLIKKAAICVAAVLCAGSFGMTAGITGVNVYAETEEISRDMMGQYVTQGYENPAYGFKIQLPETYVLQARESMVSLVEEEDMDTIEKSNSDGAYSKIQTEASLGSTALLFSANTQDSSSAIVVQLQTPGIGMDHWDEESVIAQNTAETFEDTIKETLGDGVEITNFETNVDTMEFAGKEHAVGMYKCKINEVPYYGVEIYLRSDDGKSLVAVDMSSLDADEISKMETYFSVME